MKPKNIKSLQSQSRHLTAHWVKDNQIEVQSSSDPDEKHYVSFRFGDDGLIHADCTCEWAQFNGVGCSHVMAALQHLANFKNRTLSFWINPEDARRQKQRVFTLEGDSEEKLWITSRAG